MIDQPAIFIDQKRYRIRIYKRTLHMLGDPQFIQLLIHPKEYIIVVRAAAQSDGLTHRVVWKSFIGKQSYELNSKNLVQKIQHACPGWVNGQSYRLFGEIVPSENIAVFDMRKAEPDRVYGEA